MTTTLETSPEELFMLLGEAQFIRRRLEQRVKELLVQGEEMSKVIEDLRADNSRLKEENGRLE